MTQKPGLPKWVSVEQARVIHEKLIERFGGGRGIRDIGLLESALAKAEQYHAYGQSDLCALAAAYAFGIARNHPFVDGNKRTAYTVAALFLQYNGLKLSIPSVSQQIAVFEGLAAGKVTHRNLTEYYQKNTCSEE